MQGSIVSRLVPLVAWLFVASLLGLWLVVAINNRDTDYHLNHVTGAWIGMSHWAVNGSFYPPMEHEGVYAGTRFGPLAVALQAAAHSISGDPIVGPKLLHIAYMLAVMAGLFVLLRRLRLPNHTSALLSCLPLMTWVGWEASTTIRHDLFALAIQLWAVVLLSGRERVGVGRVLTVATLCALAPLVKFSELWATAACGLYLLCRHRKALLVFVPAWLGVLAAGLGLAEWVSHGHFSETLWVCLFSGERPFRQLPAKQILNATTGLLGAMSRDPVLWVLLPPGLIGTWVGRRKAPLITLSFGFVLLMTAYLWTRLGVASNHLLDLIALAVLGAGQLLSICSEASDEPADAEQPKPALGRQPVMTFAVAFLLIAGAPLLLTPQEYGEQNERARVFLRALSEMAGRREHVTARQAVEKHLDPGDRVLSCDASVPVLLGQDPVLIDPYMFRVYAQSHPAAAEALAARVAAHEFDAVLLVTIADAGFRKWDGLAQTHWGGLVLGAIREHYTFESAWDYATYRPTLRGNAPDPTPPPAD